MESSLPQHSRKSGNWYTPELWWVYIRTMGPVHTDPCTDGYAAGKAERYSWGANGELEDWVGNVFCNPPGNPRGMPRKFFKRCVEHYAAYRFQGVHVIYLAYSLEQLAWMPDVLQDNFPMSVCIPRKRIAFLNKKGDPQRSPTHSNAFIYFGSEHEKFRRVFPGLHLTRGNPLSDYKVL